jgi:hypothetical protein
MDDDTAMAGVQLGAHENYLNAEEFDLLHAATLEEIRRRGRPQPESKG